jgi:hypothetical protein
MRCLLVSPHFPPCNAPDMQRVRLILPYLSKCGVDAEVLAVQPQQTQFSEDPWLEAGLPGAVPVHRVRGLGRWWERIPGFGSVGLRALRALAKGGDEILRTGHFDLIYFSTAVVEAHLLGPRWRRKYKVPFIVDYQDPWVDDYYRGRPRLRPPGGRLKHAMANTLHRYMEPFVLRHASGITAVSPSYPQQLFKRYAWAKRLPVLVQPFPGDEQDLVRAASASPVMRHWQSGLIHWVYAGAIAPPMLRPVRALFAALRDHAPGLVARLRLHFIGTGYAGGNPVVSPLAREYGLQAVVDEHPRRIPYSEVLAVIKQAHALLVIGSDDATYTASKLYPYLLARKPLLAIVHERSPIADVMKRVRGGVCIGFADEDENALAARVSDLWLAGDQHLRAVELDHAAFAPHTAGEATRELVEFFRQTVQPS